MIKKFWDKQLFRQFSYLCLIAVAIILLWLLGQKIFNFGQLFEAYELKTYDLRADMAAKKRQHNPDIVILAIDDVSSEVLQDELGRWPWSRDVHADVVEYLVKDGAALVAFDLMFVGHHKGFEKQDQKFIDTVTKYDNVYLSMNFDVVVDESGYFDENHTPPEVPEKFSVNLENRSKIIDFSNFTFNNCRFIMDELVEGTDKIGFINFMRSPIDKIARKGPTFFRYEGSYYPYLGLKLASDYIELTENVEIDKYVINENNELVFGNRSFHVDENGSIIIDWYGPQFTYEYIPFWKVYKSVLPEGYFKDKVVFIGATMVSTFDIKSTPVSSIMPGVEVQATVFNNIIDNQSVKRVSGSADLLISLILSFIVAFIVIKLPEPIISSLITVFIILAYFFTASMLLDQHQIWVGIVSQVVFIAVTFTAMYIIKYVLKAKDFEYTYKLATTDGLTELYNHRFFQEKLKEHMKKADRTDAKFSIVLIDIDFFKKFNDTYGHQAGDEVLRQVARVLKRSVKSDDIVARYGGEEMVLILADADTDSALTIADRICKTIAARNFVLAEGLQVNVTISLGVATYPVHGKHSTELIEFADKGLYRAKENGRNQIGAMEDREKTAMEDECSESNT